MRKFHPLTIKEIRPETRDSVRISFDIPEELRDDYSFIPGQHLPFEIQLDGKKLRRTYSICSAQGQPLEIGIRVVRALDVRPVVFAGKPVRTPLYDRASLQPGTNFSGPAIVVEYSSTTAIPPGWQARVDGYRNLILETETVHG